jgi:hypothetical protein
MSDPHDLNVPLHAQLHFTVADFATVLKPKTGNRKPTIRFTLPKAGNGIIGSSVFSWATSMPKRTYPADFHTTMGWHLVHEMTLPGGYRPVLVPDPLEKSFGRFEAKSETKARGNKVTNEAWFWLKDPLVPVAEYQNLRGLLAATEELERQHVMLKPSEE